VELDLQLPSMTHGKKGFDRIVHAFKTVLNQSLAWLFADLDHSDLNSGMYISTSRVELRIYAHTRPGPVSLHHPILYDIQPEITKLPDVIVPIINSEESISDPMYEEQLLEWLGMVSLESPRLRPGSIDRYLCRYDLPEEFESEDMAALAPQNLVRLRWHGFAPSKFILNTWLIPKAALKEHWFALSASTFADTSYSIFCSGGRNVLLWECG
jgi:ribonuclease P/MRP protein subunit RPP40